MLQWRASLNLFDNLTILKKQTGSFVRTFVLLSHCPRGYQCPGQVGKILVIHYLCFLSYKTNHPTCNTIQIMLRGNDFHQNYGLRDYKYFTLNKRFLLNNENSVLCLILLHQAVMVMSLSLSPEAGERTTPTVLHFTLQDLCLMSVSKLPVLVKRKRRLFP